MRLARLLMFFAALMPMSRAIAQHVQDRAYVMTVISSEWINLKQFQDIGADVLVEQVTPEVFSLKFTFRFPIDPVHGISPSAFHNFAFCLASKLAKKNRFSHWSLGALDRNVKYQNTIAIELFVGFSNDTNPLPGATKEIQIQWLDRPVASKEFYEACGKLLSTEVMWNQ